MKKENAPSVAAEQGVKAVYEAAKLLPEYSAAFPILAMHWGALV